MLPSLDLCNEFLSHDTSLGSDHINQRPIQAIESDGMVEERMQKVRIFNCETRLKTPGARAWTLLHSQKVFRPAPARQGDLFLDISLIEPTRSESFATPPGSSLVSRKTTRWFTAPVNKGGFAAVPLGKFPRPAETCSGSARRMRQRPRKL
jgi:hypothetical protein